MECKPFFQACAAKRVETIQKRKRLVEEVGADLYRALLADTF